MPKVVHIGRKGPKVWAEKGWKVLDAQPFGQHWIVTLQKESNQPNREETLCQISKQATEQASSQA